MRKITVNKSLVEVSDSHSWITEASTIGLLPGQWPDFITVANDEWDTETIFQFSRDFRSPDGEELGGVFYQTKDGLIRLTVFND